MKPTEEAVVGKMKKKEPVTKPELLQLAEYFDEHRQDWAAMSQAIAFMLRSLAV